MVREPGVDTCTPPHLKWVASRDPLWSAGAPPGVAWRPGGDGVWGGRRRTAEPLCRPPETITDC